MEFDCRTTENRLPRQLQQFKTAIFKSVDESKRVNRRCFSQLTTCRPAPAPQAACFSETQEASAGASRPARLCWAARRLPTRPVQAEIPARSQTQPSQHSPPGVEPGASAGVVQAVGLQSLVRWYAMGVWHRRLRNVAEEGGCPRPHRPSVSARSCSHSRTAGRQEER